MAFNDEPTIPFPPYDYSIGPFPSHIYNDTIDIGYEGRRSPFDDENTLQIDDDKATLGRVLFYDTKLSSSEKISCASCHKQEFSFADGKAKSNGVTELTSRNSMHLNGMAWNNTSFYSWDMEHETIEEMIALPLNDPNEIGLDMDMLIDKLFNTTYYPHLFQAAYGHPLATEEKIKESLIHFMFSMVSFDSKHDQGASIDFENFSASELLGLELFKRNCSSCHSQGRSYYIHSSINRNGLPEDSNDLGAGVWDSTLMHAFKLTSLRNIEVTNPYMHDGRFETLEEVVEHYSDTLVTSPDNWFLPPQGFQFNKVEQEALVDFMKTFTDHTFLTEEKWSDPFKGVTSSIDLQRALNLSIYPNPASDLIQISFSNSKSENVSIELLTASGSLISTYSTIDNAISIDGTDLSPGMYILRLRLGDEQVAKKLVVK